MPTPDPARLAAVLDLLLPGDGDFPPAGALGLAPRTEELHPDPAELADLLDAVGDAPDAAALQALEAERTEAFDRLVAAAYNAYYTDRRVLETVERLTGYEARPPQPLGHPLPPFDEGLLETVRRRPPSWRPA